MQSEIKYIVIIQRPVVNRHSDIDMVYCSDMKKFDTLEEAKAHGFTLDVSDDFNIGRLIKGRFTQLFWMDKVVTIELNEYEEIERHLGIV